jgi:anti-anti-sigma factor
MFNFRYETVGQNKDIIAVILAGTLDESTCQYLLDCVKDEVLEGSTKLIIDCGGLEYVSSMGLGMLVRVNSRMKKLGGEVKLAAVHGPVAQVLKVVGLNRLFEIHPTVEAAIAAHEGK